MRDEYGLDWSRVGEWLCPQGDFVSEGVEHLGYIWEEESGAWEVGKLEIVELAGEFQLVPVVVHDGLVDGEFYHLHCLHVVLDIVADVGEFFHLLLHAFPEEAQVCLQRGPMAEDSVIAHVLLYFEDILDLFEVAGDFAGQGVEVLLRAEQDILALLVPLPDLIDIVRQLSDERLYLSLPLALYCLLVAASPHRTVPSSNFHHVVSFACEHDRAFFAVVEVLMSFGVGQCMGCQFVVVVEAGGGGGSVGKCLFVIGCGFDAGVIVVVEVQSGQGLPHGYSLF